MKYTLLPHKERLRDKYAVQPIPVRYLSAKEVARRYQLSEAWVHHCQGLRPYKRKIGKYLRFLESDLEEFEAYRAEWPRESRTGKLSAGRQGYDIVNKEDPADIPIVQSHKDPHCSEGSKGKLELKFDIL